jgi:hypothetical protein
MPWRKNKCINHIDGDHERSRFVNGKKKIKWILEESVVKYICPNHD